MRETRVFQTIFSAGAALSLFAFPGGLSWSAEGGDSEAGKKVYETEIWKIYHAEDYVLPPSEKPGPAGGPWDSHYRRLIKDSVAGKPGGKNSHEEAIDAIVEDAKASPENIQMHKYYTLFTTAYSAKYRTIEAKLSLRNLYRKLVHLELGMEPPWEPGPETDSFDAGGRPYEGDKRLTIHRDVAYGSIQPELQNLDAYLVKSDKPTPVVIEFHGGGWRRGAKSNFTVLRADGDDQFGKFFDAGMSVVSANYRLTNRHPMPAPMEDAMRVVQFVRSKAKEWNIDPNRVCTIGGSAGGHLSAWIGLSDDGRKPDSADPVERESTRLTCFVACWGPTDFTRFDPLKKAREGGRGPDYAAAFEQAIDASIFDYRTPEALAKAKAVSPAYLVTSDDPPGFLYYPGPETVTSSEHKPIPEIDNDAHGYTYGVQLADAMDKAGVEVTRRIGPEWQDKKKGADSIVEYLKKQLRGE